MIAVGKGFSYEHQGVKPHEAALVGMAKLQALQRIRKPSMTNRYLVRSLAIDPHMSDAQAVVLTSFAHAHFGEQYRNSPTGPVGTIKVMQYHLQPAA